MSKPKYVQVIKGADGVERHYVRRGATRIPLKSSPGSAEYHREYAAALDKILGRTPVTPTRSGNGLAHWVDVYLRSAEVQSNCRKNQQDKRRDLAALIKGHEDKSPNSLTWDYIMRVRDTKFSTPCTQNQFSRNVMAFLNSLVVRSVIPYNPMPRGRGSKVKHNHESHLVWRQTHFDRFRSYWPCGTKQRVAFELLYNTGARCKDVRLLGPDSVIDGEIVMPFTSKDGEPVIVPLLPETLQAIEALASSSRYFVPRIRGSLRGQAQTSDDLSSWFSKACAKAGLPSGYTAHGVRHGVATKLAEVGHGAEVIQALLGHKTERMAALYTKQARRSALARAAVKDLATRPIAS